jgi:ferredoxin
MRVLSRLFRRKASLTARLEPEGRSFPVSAGQSLLDAALAAGIPWPSRCRVGSCGVCRCRVESGRINPTSDFSYVLKPHQIADGAALACQTRLKTDVVVRLGK